MPSAVEASLGCPPPLTLSLSKGHAQAESRSVIPALSLVIPAKAGIQHARQGTRGVGLTEQGYFCFKPLPWDGLGAPRTPMYTCRMSSNQSDICAQFCALSMSISWKTE